MCACVCVILIFVLQLCFSLFSCFKGDHGSEAEVYRLSHRDVRLCAPRCWDHRPGPGGQVSENDTVVSSKMHIQIRRHGDTVACCMCLCMSAAAHAYPGVSVGLVGGGLSINNT